jgi:protein CpxP
MKAIIASFALVIVLCGQATGQETSPPFPGPDQRPPSPMMGQSEGRPPRMAPRAEREWWKDPELLQKLQVSDDQVRRIEKIVQDHQTQEVDLRAALEKQDATLRPLMETGQPDEPQVLAQIDKVAQARANLEKSHVQMLLAVRRVLTAEQLKKLRDLRRNRALPMPGFGPPEGAPGPPPGDPPERTPRG